MPNYANFVIWCHDKKIAKNSQSLTCVEPKYVKQVSKLKGVIKCT